MHAMLKLSVGGSARLRESETRCLREEKAILSRKPRAM